MRTRADVPVCLTEAEIWALPLQHEGREWPGVQQRILWEDDGSDSYAAVMTLRLGCRIPRHVHEDAALHIWVVEGRLGHDGRMLPSGSYVFVPAGVEHGLAADPTNGCTLFVIRTAV